MITDYFSEEISEAFDRLRRTSEHECVDKALEDLKAMADGGDATACAVVGWAYRMPHIRHLDYDLSRSYLQKSSDAGDMVGEYYLGMLLFSGQPPFEQDRVYGRWLLEQSASQGCNDAAQLLYRNDHDYTESEVWRIVVRGWFQNSIIEPLRHVFCRRHKN